MTPTAVDDTARAILDGTPPDWGRLERSDDGDTRALAEQLRVLSAVARVHRADAVDRDGLGRWGHLRLLEQVGAGAFGDVYRAWDTRLDREVALKLLPVETTTGPTSSPIIEEGRLLARVRHPNIVTIYGAESIDGRIGLWMEFIRGRTLEALLRSGHQFSRSEVIQVGLEVCRAVSAVHAAGLLHRDIKAQNVMRADDGRVVLMDFGAGRDRDAATGDVSGTPLYLAPEQLDGQPATVQSDVYALGVLLYRLLTGAYPVQAASIAELRTAHQRGDRATLAKVRPDLPAALVALVERAVDPDLSRRYDSCDRLATELLALVRPSRWRRVALAGLVAAGVVAAAWGGWQASGRRGSDRSGTLLAGAGAIGPWAGERPMVAVRPFRNLSATPDADLIVDGLTYELIRNLAVVDGLMVRSATSSFALKGAAYSLADIGQRLGVNLVLEGSVSESDGQLRVQAQLAHVGSDTPIWTARFDRPATNMLGIQDEIARGVVNHLRLALGRGQRRYDLDRETSELYLKARTLTERRGTLNAEVAVSLFNQIIARDPAFAPAYAGLAAAYAYMSQALTDVGGLPHEQALGLVRTAAERAMEIDPLLAEAHAAMGLLHSREFAWAEADRSFRRAIDLNPGLTPTYTIYSLTTLLPQGRFEEAETLLFEARQRDPLSLDVQREVALLQLTRGQYDDAIRTMEQVLTVERNYPAVELLLARARSLAGRIDEAMPYWESVRAEIGMQQWLAYAYVRAGRRAEVERMLLAHTSAYRQAIIYTALGDHDRALDALDRAAVEAPHRVVRLLQYPELAELRDDPRFAAIRARFGLP
jgi:serine/threonine-protein kinase